MRSIKEIENSVKEMRLKALDIAYHCQNKLGAHYGSGFSMMEIFAALYSGVANISPENRTDPNRDRIIPSKGHCVLGYYAALNMAGFISDDLLYTFDTNNTSLHGHPTRNLDRGIEFSAGSLGLGASFAVGVAYSCKLAGLSNRIFLIVGDGELQEGIIWEAMTIASSRHLSNLTVIVDRNRIQFDDFVENINDMESIEDKFKSFGFATDVVDGHNVEALIAVLSKRYDRTNVVIADTVKAKGISFLENKPESHYYAMKESEYLQALEEIKKG